MMRQSEFTTKTPTVCQMLPPQMRAEFFRRVMQLRKPKFRSTHRGDWRGMVKVKVIGLWKYYAIR